ncbi:MAG: type II secretion system protein [Patescibacteria group bacterium]|nr:type II secretion system protein [Patescibacteria group bacterium]
MTKSIKNKGFTLLELLVVISIIGILIALGVAAFSTVQKKGRDARRRGDMKAAQKAMEQYYAENDSDYPAASSCSDICSALGNDFLPGGMPQDPKTGSPTYFYSCTSTASSLTDPASNTYCLCAYLETGGGNSNEADCTDWSQGGDYFCVSNLQ